MHVPRSTPRALAPALLLMLGAMVACGGDDDVTPPPPPTPQPGAISGTVVAGGQGVAGATITLTQAGATTRTATSGATGTFQFSDVAAGAWQVGITPPAGFVLAAGQTSPVSVTVTAGQTATVTLQLAADMPATTGRIAGAARRGNQGIQGVTVDLSNAGGAVASRTTPADGSYAFEDVDAGEYTVTVTLPAAFQLAAGENAEKPATVSVGQTTTVNYSVDLAQASPVVQVALQTSPNRFVGPGGGSTETVGRGTTIRWVNDASVFHTVTPDGHTAWQRTETAAPGPVLEALFLNPGTFNYFCEPHQGEGMTGSIVVQ